MSVARVVAHSPSAFRSDCFGTSTGIERRGENLCPPCASGLPAPLLFEYMYNVCEIDSEGERIRGSDGVCSSCLKGEFEARSRACISLAAWALLQGRAARCGLLLGGTKINTVRDVPPTSPHRRTCHFFTF